VEDRTVSSACHYSKICSTDKAFLRLHSLQEAVGTAVEDLTVSSAKRADFGTVSGYTRTQHPTQIDVLGAPTFMQAVPNEHACSDSVNISC
jgi:hypothetical protein